MGEDEGREAAQGLEWEEKGLEWEGLECSYFLSSRLELGFFISINAQPNFYGKRNKKGRQFCQVLQETKP